MLNDFKSVLGFEKSPQLSAENLSVPELSFLRVDHLLGSISSIQTAAEMMRDTERRTGAMKNIAVAKDVILAGAVDADEKPNADTLPHDNNDLLEEAQRNVASLAGDPVPLHGPETIAA